MTYTQERRPPRRQRSTLDSPLLSALLVVVVVGLLGVLVVPGLLSPGGPTPTGPAALPTGAPASAGPSVAPTFVRPTPSPGPTFRSYTVKAGDSLNSIARQFRTTARSIAWWNRGTYPSLDPLSAAYDPNTIRVGWVLMVIPDTVVDDNNPPPASPALSPATTGGGDTLGARGQPGIMNGGIQR